MVCGNCGLKNICLLNTVKLLSLGYVKELKEGTQGKQMKQWCAEWFPWAQTSSRANKYG